MSPLSHAAMDAVFTYEAGFAQGFYDCLWETWETGARRE
jgi:hypothetical protein